MRMLQRAVLAGAAGVALLAGGMAVGAGTASAATVGCTGNWHAVSTYSYTFTDPDGTVRTGTSLRQAISGDTVTVRFTVNPVCTTADVSIASYTSPTPYSSDTFTLLRYQQLYDSATGTFAGGSTGTLTVRLPVLIGATASCPNPHELPDNGNGANVSGPYDSTCNGAPSGNGNGNGNAKGKPCAGCVGNADNKNPKGQLPGPKTDGNNGYECDNNNGVGKTNPAHSGCGSPHMQVDFAVGSVIPTLCPSTATSKTDCTYYLYRLAPSPSGPIYTRTLINGVFM